MHTKIRPYALVILASTTAWTGANAASISLAPKLVTAAVGDSVFFDLNMDFSDNPTLGGGIDLVFNTSLLEFSSFARNPALGDDVDGRRDLDVVPGTGLDGLAFFKFGGGIAGPARVGTFTFKALGAGRIDVTLSADVGGTAGPFISATTNDPQNVTFTGAAIDISPSAVPLPGALPLMLSLGAGLAGFVRRRSTTV